MVIGDYWPPQVDVLFDFNRDTIKPSERPKLDNLVKQSSSWQIESVVVTGYADHLGTSTYNDALSLRRALTVKTYLVSKELPEEKIYTEGKGARNRVTTGCDDRGRARAFDCLAPDRRVEVEMTGIPK